MRFINKVKYIFYTLAILTSLYAQIARPQKVEQILCQGLNKAIFKVLIDSQHSAALYIDDELMATLIPKLISSEQFIFDIDRAFNPEVKRAKGPITVSLGNKGFKMTFDLGINSQDERVEIEQRCLLSYKK